MSEPKSNANARRALLSGACMLLVGACAAAQTAPRPVTSHRHKPPAAQPAAQQPPVQQFVPPPQPEQPKWPVNDAPSQPSVTWDSQGLRIQATNSSLSAILNQVETQTGAKVEGMSGDERVFGEFGPGQPRDVLSQLLHGSSYDFLLLGAGDGPLKVILSTRHATPQGGQQGNQGFNRQMPAEVQQEDESVPEPEPEPEPPPAMQPMRAPDQGNPNGMTPQQRMQMMQQQRLQQMQQMQQQYQQQQQGQQQPQ